MVLSDLNGLKLSEGINIIKDEYTYEIVPYLPPREKNEGQIFHDRARIVRVKETENRHLQLIICMF